MSVYPCEDFAIENNQSYRHQDDCLICKVLKERDNWCNDCQLVDADIDYVCSLCIHDYEENES